jgi:hypothetical protein
LATILLVVVLNDDVQQSVKHKLDFYEWKSIFPKKKPFECLMLLLIGFI